MSLESDRSELVEEQHEDRQALGSRLPPPTPSSGPTQSSGFWPLLVGSVSGGFVARLLLELTRRPWPWPVVALVAALMAVAGALLARRLVAKSYFKNFRNGDWWPLLLLAIYVFWPQRPILTSVLLLVALTALTLFLGRGRWRQATRLPLCRLANLLTFVVSLLLYTLTAAPDVLPADSGEFQIVAPLLGVAHPPGYPLYTMLGWLATRLFPIGNAAYRLNLLSALFAAGTVTLLGASTRIWSRRAGAPLWAAVVGGLATALTLGSATTFWSQATLANIRMPTAFAAAAAFYALARYADARDRQQADRALLLLALALSLGISHHPSLIFLGIFMLGYLVLVDPRLPLRPRRWWKALLIAVVALLPLLYLPIRGAANAPLAPSDLDTWHGLVHHVTAQGFEGDMFYFANAEDLANRLTLLPTLLLFQFNPALLVAATLGLVLLLGRNRRLALLLGGGLILHTFVSITYRAPQTVEYMMPAYLPIALLAGLFVGWMLSLSHRSTARVSGLGALLPALILMAGVSNGLAHGPSFFTLARDRSTRTSMATVLGDAPSDALILADWRWATPLWYLQRVEGQRPDIEIRYVWPVPGQEYPDTWRDRIDQVADTRPLIVTHFYDLAAYTLEPLGRAFLVHRRPYTDTPEGLGRGLAPVPSDAVFRTDGGGLRLVGVHLEPARPMPGQAVELTLVWQAVDQFAVPPSLSAKLLKQNGQQLAQADRSLGADYAPGEVRFERLVLPIYPNTPPGEYRLALQVYNIADAGFEIWPSSEGADLLDLTTVSVRPYSTPPYSLQPLGTPFAGGPTLVGVDYDRSLAGALRVYLHWRGPARGGERIVIEGIEAPISALPEGGFETVVLDLPGELLDRPGMTLIGPDGRVKAAAGVWGVETHEVRLPVPDPGARFVPLNEEMALISMAPEKASFAPGDQVLLRPTFVALRPLVNDYSISVRLLSEDGFWLARHDLQPGLGAIPTLKWIRGSRVTDPHPLRLPPDVSGDVVRAEMAVYENFRGVTFPALDGRMERVPLGEWRLLRP